MAIMGDRPMPNRRVLAGMAAAAALALQPGALAAQTSDNATVEALANLVAADQPLSLTGVAPLNFGQVVIPRRGDIACGYDILGDGQRSVSEGTVNHGEGPTPSGCSYRDTSSERASLTLRCEADRPITLTIRAESNNLQGGAVRFATFDDYIEVDGQERYSWDERCTGEEMTLRVGGFLIVEGEAVPSGGEVQVGAITLEAFYP